MTDFCQSDGFLSKWQIFVKVTDFSRIKGFLSNWWIFVEVKCRSECVELRFAEKFESIIDFHFLEIELLFLLVIRKTWKNFLTEKFLVAYVTSRSNIIKWYFNYIQQQEKIEPLSTIEWGLKYQETRIILIFFLTNRHNFNNILSE